MSLFNQILGAINNPNQQASAGQVGQILGVVQQLAGSRGLDASTTQTVMSLVGGHVRSALQQQQASGGPDQVAEVVNRHSGTTPSVDALSALFTPQQQGDVAQDVAQKTGLNVNTIQAMLPTLVPVVLNLLQSGSTTQAGPGGNSVLNSFLDTDGDGQVDLGDAMSLANRFFNQSR